jgi:hypothetical protein
MTDLPDEETQRSRRGRPVGPEPEDPLVSGPASSDAATETATVRSTAPSEGPRMRRATYVVAGESDEATVGSTFVARRETRRRAAREQPRADATAVPVSGSTPLALSDPAHPVRVASAPDPDLPTYRPRFADPVIAARSAPPVREPQPLVDGAAVRSAERRAARQKAIIVVIAASALVVGAAASLLVLALIP